MRASKPSKFTIGQHHQGRRRWGLSRPVAAALTGHDETCGRAPESISRPLDPATERRARRRLGEARTAIEPVLRSAVGALADPLDRMAGYHFGWCDADGVEIAGAQGKALRPALTFAAARACGGDANKAVHAAAAVELLHNFSLVHDDVMDTDPFRHGRPTVWRVWGETSATLLGDALQALALGVLCDGAPEGVTSEAVIRLARATVMLCRGQYEDCAFESRPAVTVDQYLSMAAGKTGALLGCACALGALCAGADHRVVSAMHTFGTELGLVFQLVDDFIDIWGDPEVTGKPAHSDLLHRKQSFPVVCALESETAAGRDLARLYQSRHPMTAARAARAADMIEEAGGRQRTLRHASNALDAAFESLPDEPAAADLAALARLVAHRDR
ncbi:polyprenyl synthetase family protein [Nocardia yunnanensis]|uniref:Polyprenyl synthetase family protein n=1 Tax=Nocardia yunnanensis TaxID=2382165 RepID=A0A386ZGB2_9NOCA|nr:polyprenyl synthetase family protein [Nocardia yunnanensis]AYF76470.1 polyprenyl synthetase family protein [Nocardia yunnanensis]